MGNIEHEKSKAFSIIEMQEYVPNSIVINTIISKITGNASAISFDGGEALTGEISPFDTFIQIIDGTAEIIIDDIPNMVTTGQSIIIPAYSRNTITGKQRFKMLSTVIKNGYK